ncbi:MAG TPA: hypothetical protein PLJ78_13850 [Anaerolineae bacterium]|nr:hypothetical protein [Anaerolineae bacterium]HQK15014.1 hypothetical protein [Anaerolineae bacterium]
MRPATQIEQWAAAIRARGLADVAIPLLDVLQVWGFVGSQILWMAAPFMGRQKLAPLAEALEEPETLRHLQHCLREDEIKGS